LGVKRFGWTDPTTAKPYFIASSFTVWPPPRRAPDSWVLSSPPLEEAGQRLRVELPGREHAEVQDEGRPPAHGVDVADRVGRGHLPEEVGVGGEGGDEVRGEDEGGVLPRPVDGRVVAGLHPDEQVAAPARLQPPEQPPQVRRTQFSRSAARLGELSDVAGHRPDSSSRILSVGRGAPAGLPGRAGLAAPRGERVLESG
jgi:hypothetical protein